MQTPLQKLFSGALLGDVIEQLTGQDLRIKRYNITKRRQGNGKFVCSHRTQIYSGRFLIGVAHAIWTGKSSAYTKLMRERMRSFLKRQHAKPIKILKRDSDDVLIRLFSLTTNDGSLKIEERIFLKKLARLNDNWI
jgi:hypothetical protein